MFDTDYIFCSLCGDILSPDAEGMGVTTLRKARTERCLHQFCRDKAKSTKLNCVTISLAIRDHMDPLPDVEMIPHEIDGFYILQLKVNEGRYTPYYYVGDGQRVAYVRNGDESIPATAEDMVRLVPLLWLLC